MVRNEDCIVNCIANAESALLFDKNTPYEDVLVSIETIKRDIVQRIERKKRENK